MQRTTLVLSFVSLMLLSACGDTFADRTMSGAGIGAIGGTVASAAVGGAILPGLLIGGAVGAATGAVTDASQISLGKPIWQK